MGDTVPEHTPALRVNGAEVTPILMAVLGATDSVWLTVTKVGVPERDKVVDAVRLTLEMAVVLAT